MLCIVYTVQVPEAVYNNLIKISRGPPYYLLIMFFNIFHPNYIFNASGVYYVKVYSRIRLHRTRSSEITFSGWFNKVT
jgi:hypothetical protein